MPVQSFHRVTPQKATLPESVAKHIPLRRSARLESRRLRQWQHDEVCPITLETAEALGADAYRSRVDHDRLYSRSFLKQALILSSQASQQHPTLPLYRSPWSQRDMLEDALALGLPEALEPPACLSPRRALWGLSLGVGLVLGLFYVYSMVHFQTERWQPCPLPQDLHL